MAKDTRVSIGSYRYNRDISVGKRSDTTFSSRSFTDRSTFSLYPTVFAKSIRFTISRIFYLIASRSTCRTRVISLEDGRSREQAGFRWSSRSKSIGARSGWSRFPIPRHFEVAHCFAGHCEFRYRPCFSDRRSPRLLSSRSSGASSERAIETESEPKESTVLRIAHRSRRSLLLSASHLPSLSAALFLPPALSLPPFGPSAALSCLFPPYPSSNLSIGLSSPPALPLYRTPTSRAASALGEHATPRSCRWILLCASTKEAQRGSGTHASILSKPSVHTAPFIPHRIAMESERGV